MACRLCRTNETRPGETAVVLERGTTPVIVQGIPAEVCASGGEP